MKVLVIDVGGTHVKVASTEHLVPVKIVSGPDFTASQLVSEVLRATKDWEYDAVTIGYPGPVKHNKPTAEPHNLGSGWVSFAYEDAFPKPVRFLNDAAMQALGGYKGGSMLFLGIGTGLGSALVIDHMVVSMELAHLPYKKGRTYEEYIGLAGMERRGKKKWRRTVEDVIKRLRAAFVVDYVVLGGGNAKLMKTLPEGVQLGANSNAIAGGIALWMGREVATVAGESDVSSKTIAASLIESPAARKGIEAKAAPSRTAASSGKAAPKKSSGTGAAAKAAKKD